MTICRPLARASILIQSLPGAYAPGFMLTPASQAGDSAVTPTRRRSWRGFVFVGLTLSNFPAFAVNAQQPSTNFATVQKAVRPADDLTASLTEAAGLMKAGKLDEAEVLVRGVVSGAPRDPNAHILLGVILDQKGQPAAAEAAYREALRFQPKNTSALTNLGVLLARTKRIDQAIETFETVLKIQPDHGQAISNLGTLYAARGDYQKAIQLLERASAWPTIKTAGSDRADVPLLLSLVNAYAHAGREKDAITLSDWLEPLAGNDPRTLFTLALSLAEAHEYPRAIHFFERTNKLRPGTFEVLYNLGVALYNVDRLDEATEALSAAASANPVAPEPYYRLGLIASARGDSKSAFGFWAKALDLRPGFAEVNFMVGEELLRERKAEQALPYYEQSLKEDPSKLLYYIRLGVANFRSQRYPNAREIFARGLVRFPDNANLYFLLGYASRAEGLYDDAVSAFVNALKLQPDNPDVLSSLGYIASQRGQHEAAERYLRRAIELDPKSYPPYHDLGRLLVKLKRYDEALPLLKHGAELNTTDAGVHYQLFLAYSRLKRKDEADKELAEFKRLDEPNRHGATPLGDTVRTEPGMEVEVLPPLPSAASGDSTKPRTP